jgi:hypothetical protein
MVTRATPIPRASAVLTRRTGLDLDGDGVAENLLGSI